uniref:Uncharacterized protein n=1 Tax=Arundo donax TaxID=35708 RepID=A0A0A9E1P5_ARUDO
MCNIDMTQLLFAKPSGSCVPSTNGAPHAVAPKLVEVQECIAIHVTTVAVFC